MANRYFTQHSYSLEKAPVRLFATVAIGATGAPTLQAYDGKGNASAAGAAGYKGIKSVARSNTGLYNITLQDSYVRLLGLDAQFFNTAASAALGGFWVNRTNTNVQSATAPVVQVQFINAAGAAVELGSGEQLQFEIVLSNSSAQ